MLIREYRIPLPLTLEEYQLGQLYSTAELSRLETGGGEGVEFLENKHFNNTPLFDNTFDSGFHTVKIYHVASKVPHFIRLLIDQTKMDIYEEAWNAFPYCRTVITNPGYMKENFTILIESMHLRGRGDEPNAHKLDPESLKKRSVVYIDIGNDPFTKSDYKKEADPSIFKSKKTDRGPLIGDWMCTCEPVMTCYKLVTVEFKWFGLQKKVENIIQDAEHKLFLRFHRQLFCWIDRWYDLSLDEIRNFELKTKMDLDAKLKRGSLKGYLFNGSIEEL